MAAAARSIKAALPSRAVATFVQSKDSRPATDVRPSATQQAAASRSTRSPVVLKPSLASVRSTQASAKNPVRPSSPGKPASTPQPRLPVSSVRGNQSVSPVGATQPVAPFNGTRSGSPSSTTLPAAPATATQPVASVSGTQPVVPATTSQPLASTTEGKAVAAILGKAEPLPRAYLTTSSKDSRWSDTSQGQNSSGQSNEISAYRYYLEADGDIRLVQKTTRSTSSSNQSNTSPESVEYFRFYYGDNSMTIASFREELSDNGSKVIVLNNVKTIKIGSSPDRLITEEIGFRAPSWSNPDLISYAFATNAGATSDGVQFKQYNTPYDTKYDGLRVGYAPLLSSIDLKADLNSNQLSFVRNDSDGDYEKSSGTYGLKDQVFNLAVKGAGDPSRRRSSDGSYLVSSSFDSKLSAFAGALETLKQWTQSDVLDNEQGTNPGSAFESFVTSAILKQKPYAMRPFSNQNTSSRSNGIVSTYKVSHQVDPLTGLYLSGESQSSGKNLGQVSNLLEDYSSAGTYKNTYESKPSAYLDPGQVSALDSQLSDLLSRGKAIASKYNFADWAGSKQFHFSGFA